MVYSHRSFSGIAYSGSEKFKSMGKHKRVSPVRQAAAGYRARLFQPAMTKTSQAV
jgi:hypothetical protein